MREKVLVSACLLGVNCKYNGKNNYCEQIEEYLQKYELIPVCPEIFGGLPTPRVPSEIKDGRVVTKDGQNVTENFLKGAKETLYLARKYNIKKAILKAKSPSCGHNQIYDGNFQDKLIKGDGITTKLLKENGIEIITIKW